MVKERSLLIEIPEKVIVGEFGWLSDKGNTREGVVRTYILKHPEVIESNLTIENLLGINVWLNKWNEEDENLLDLFRETDIVFEKDGIYYLVETKRWKKYSRGWEQLGDVVDCFKSDFKKHKTKYKDFIPVLVTTTDRINKIKREWC